MMNKLANTDNQTSPGKRFSMRSFIIAAALAASLPVTAALAQAPAAAHAV
jgi:hypothetical protein